MVDEVFSDEYFSKDDNLIKFFDNIEINNCNNSLLNVTVIDIVKEDVIIRLNPKFTPVIKKEDIKSVEDLKPGSNFDIFVEKMEDKNGQTVFSISEASYVKTWNLIYESLNNYIVLEGIATKKLTGGLIVDINGISVFLPGSQIEAKNVEDYDAYINKPISFIVTKINKKSLNVIVSHKLISEKEKEKKDKILISKIKKGEVYEGIVTNFEAYGAFVNIGGVTGLLYITDISWTRINHPSDVLEIGQKIKVVVTECDPEKSKLYLGLKYLTPSPWEEIKSKDYKKGDLVTGKIVNIESYGAFLEIIPGVEGLIHISDLSWNLITPKISDVFKINDKVTAKIIDINIEEKKISLGIKQMKDDPWNIDGINELMAVGTKHLCEVIDVKPFGYIVKTENELCGFLGEKELSWVEVADVEHFLKVGDKVELIVLNFNKEDRKLSFSLKRMQENPWEVCEKVFTVGSEHEGTVVRKNTKGFFVKFEKGICGFVDKKHIPNNISLEINNVYTFKIILYDKANFRMNIVHKDFKYDLAKSYDMKPKINNGVTFGDTFGDIFKKNDK